MIAEVGADRPVAGDLPVTADLEAGYGDPGGTIARAIDVGIVGAQPRGPDEAARPSRCAPSRPPSTPRSRPGSPSCSTPAPTRSSRPATATPRRSSPTPSRAGRPTSRPAPSSFFVPGKLDEAQLTRIVGELGERKVNIIGIPGSISLEAAQRIGIARVSYGPWSQNTALTALAKLAEDVYAGGGLPADTRKLN